jgi:hypothetical protein
MILHDWDDDHAARVLQTIAASARPDARLVALELVMPDDDAMHLSRMIDLTMLGMLTGRERTVAEHAELLAAGGFRMLRVLGSAGPMSVIEAALA